ncbi:MAG TPA: hypothetical protein VEQ58_13095 [Polyangiaceae bacterium]|nr:hypothetical protein [Polyangiaceae bacterium]
MACGSSDPTGSGGVGKLSFTTWGEDYVENRIPTDSAEVAGFVDGWQVEYSKFLVNFRKIRVADKDGNEAAVMEGSMLFDNHVKGVKSIIDFDGVEAKAWQDVSYEIAPVTDETKLSDSVTEEDRQLMVDGGYSFYVEATASKGEVKKHYTWGFAIGTRYEKCHSEQDGKDEEGLVVTNNSELEIQLTTHGDHPYYDRLQASPDPAIPTSLRFDTLADADQEGDGFGELTLDELDAAPLNVKLYNPSPFKALTQGAFVTALARTIGHFRGEGECTISEL